MKNEYIVKRCSESIAIDADWNKPLWQGVEPIEIGLPHWLTQSEHLPRTEVKLQYDPKNFYVIFRVQDRYVRAMATGVHGEIWKDSCVEFFFAPYSGQGTSYLNLEVNCCGVPLMQHHDGPRTGSCFLNVEQCQQIEIAASMQGPIEKEITEPLTWTLEYRLPYEILTAYPEFEKPAPGVCWRANFYKCADDSSHPHWLAWSLINRQQPDFHRPEFFGVLQFE
ncbi:MAG: carbohydrate-binding family 9-like protein [Planctomycetota bacterium]